LYLGVVNIELAIFKPGCGVPLLSLQEEFTMHWIFIGLLVVVMVMGSAIHTVWTLRTHKIVVGADIEKGADKTDEKGQGGKPNAPKKDDAKKGGAKIFAHKKGAATDGAVHVLHKKQGSDNTDHIMKEDYKKPAPTHLPAKERISMGDEQQEMQMSPGSKKVKAAIAIPATRMRCFSPEAPLPSAAPLPVPPVPSDTMEGKAAWILPPFVKRQVREAGSVQSQPVQVSPSSPMPPLAVDRDSEAPKVDPVQYKPHAPFSRTLPHLVLYLLPIITALVLHAACTPVAKLALY
jgi:hypothetical protein